MSIDANSVGFIILAIWIKNKNMLENWKNKHRSYRQIPYKILQQENGIKELDIGANFTAIFHKSFLYVNCRHSWKKKNFKKTFNTTQGKPQKVWYPRDREERFTRQGWISIPSYILPFSRIGK